MELKHKRTGHCRDCATRPLCLMSDVPDREIALIEPAIRQLSIRKAAVVFRRGDWPKTVRIVKVGQVVGTLPAGGVARPVILSGRGTPIGLFQLFNRAVGLETHASMPTTLCEIPLAAMRRLPSWDGAIRRRATALAFDHFHQLTEWSAALRQETTTARIAACLLLLQREDPDLFIPMPTTVMWAKLVGAARETVSRALAKLEAQGGYKRQGKLIRVNTALCERYGLIKRRASRA